MTDVEVKVALNQAWGELLAALAVESDGGCEPELVAVHVARAWTLAHAAIERESAEGTEALPGWAAGQTSRFVGAAAARRVEAYVEQALAVAARAGHRLPDEFRTDAATGEQLTALRARLVDERRRAGIIAPAESSQVRWIKRGAAVLGALLLIVVVGLRPWELVGVGQWRGAYYPGKDFRGEPDIRREADVSFDWAFAPPTDSIPSDRFAARWDSCLVLDEAQVVTFQLIADDGARMFIDGTESLDGWSPDRPPVSVGGEVELDAGVHHIRVEYREESDVASVHLLATFDPELPPGPIPARMLQYPAEDVDADDQCGHVES